MPAATGSANFWVSKMMVAALQKVKAIPSYTSPRVFAGRSSGAAGGASSSADIPHLLSKRGRGPVGAQQRRRTGDEQRQARPLRQGQPPEHEGALPGELQEEPARAEQHQVQLEQVAGT